jgi:hypothetical protein
MSIITHDADIKRRGLTRSDLTLITSSREVRLLDKSNQFVVRNTTRRVSLICRYVMASSRWTVCRGSCNVTRTASCHVLDGTRGMAWYGAKLNSSHREVGNHQLSVLPFSRPKRGYVAVTTDVYRWMLRGGRKLETELLTEGLHRAVRSLSNRENIVPGYTKKSKISPLVWAAYIHLGVWF